MNAASSLNSQRGMLSCLRALAVIALLIGAPFAANAAESPAQTGASSQPDAARGQPAAAAREQAQPLNNAPMWRDVRSGDPDENQTTQVRGRETNVLVQTQGEIWRRVRNGPIIVFGGALLIFAIAVLAAFFMWKGPIKVHGRLTGRKILRLTVWDRTIHWAVAITFVALGISGVLLLFGKYLVLPLFGYPIFSLLALLSKNVHNFVGPVFLISAALMAATYLARNIPRKHDIMWLKKGGGMLTGKHVPSGFFNAGEKIVYWVGLCFFSVVVGVSGLVLLFPNFDQTRELMQYANIVHAVTAVFYMAMIFGHAYLGTIGLEGAWEAMRYDGTVDEQWAKEHHEYWYDEVMRKRPPAPGPVAPAPASALRARSTV
jgi:formate dehydrogenase subunit gamma